MMKHVKLFEDFDKIQEGTFDSPNVIARFSGPDGDCEVEKRKDGSYYASCEDYDFEAKDKKEMIDKLNRNGFKTLVAGKLEESHEDLQNYMFFSNLESIKRKCESILAMDFKKIDELLNEGGHDWAADHITVAKENIDQVESFLVGQFEDAHQEEPSIEVHEGISQEAAYVHQITGCGQNAAQDFIDDNGIDGAKLAAYVKQHRNGIEKYEVRDIIAGTGVGAIKDLRKRFIKEMK